MWAVPFGTARVGGRNPLGPACGGHVARSRALAEQIRARDLRLKLFGSSEHTGRGELRRFSASLRAGTIARRVTVKPRPCGPRTSRSGSPVNCHARASPSPQAMWTSPARGPRRGGGE